MTPSESASLRIVSDLDRALEIVMAPVTRCPHCGTGGYGTWVCGCRQGGGWTVVRPTPKAVTP